MNEEQLRPTFRRVDEPGMMPDTETPGHYDPQFGGSEAGPGDFIDSDYIAAERTVREKGFE